MQGLWWHNQEHGELNEDTLLSEGLEPSHHCSLSHLCTLQESITAWRQGQAPLRSESSGPIQSEARCQLVSTCTSCANSRSQEHTQQKPLVPTSVSAPNTQSLRKEFCRSHSSTQMLPRTGCTNEPEALLKAPCCAPNCFAWQWLQCYDALVFL